MDRLASHWTNPANVERLKEFERILAEFRTAQAEVERIAHSPQQFPATQILVADALPKASTMLAGITRMIDIEQELPATAERKDLLGVMADVRGTTAIGLANIRAFLLTGDPAFEQEFDKVWDKNQRRFDDLTARRSLLNAEQDGAFAEIEAARTAFLPLPAQMFEIRGSERWNLAQWALMTETAPRAGRLLSILEGEKGSDGRRQGGMVAEQIGLLEADALEAESSLSWLQIVEGALLLGGLALGLAVAFLTNRSIVTPLTAVTAVVDRLQRGEQVAVPGTERADECGELARAFAAFAEEGTNARRTQLALDTADVSVMVADANNDIVYVNKRLLEMFGAAEADIRRDLPAFRVDGLIGTNVDRFHRNPSYQQGMLAQLNGTHKAAIKMGDRDFTFIANPVRGAMGERLGTVVEWRDLTEKLALQGEIDQVVAAAGAGDFSKRIGASGMQGTMARLADGINQVTKLVEGATKDIGGMLRALAEGDLSRRITADYQGTLGELKDDANRTADQLAETVGQIQAATNEVGNAASEISAGTEDLSHRTEQAASDIKTLIQDSNGQVKDGVQLVNQAGAALADIVGSIGKVAEIVREISSASQEQASGVQQINGSVASMDEMTQQNSALVEESSAAARALSDQAVRLGDLMAFFKLDTARASVRSKPAQPMAAPRKQTKARPAPAAASDEGWNEF
ncbi:MAG: HAMP domain-containing protein [Rhodospirillaceae bacterium]|nr:HAMP domain-containing protein [Rhodospirillaceae bacterium]